MMKHASEKAYAGAAVAHLVLPRDEANALTRVTFYGRVGFHFQLRGSIALPHGRAAKSAFE